VADLPFTFTNPAIASRLARLVDCDGKIPRAIAELGEIAGRDVVVLRTSGRLRAAQLRALNAHVTASADDGQELPAACADVVVRYWGETGAVAAPDRAAMTAAERLLRPGGRLLMVMDYGRDDVARLRPEGETPEIYRALRARDAQYAAQGFKLRVIHDWWQFDSLEDAAGFLSEAFGDRGERVASEMRRPRLSHKVVLYHRGTVRAADAADRARTVAVASRGAPR
jgi:SAM-dependent methyltransferase